jgi:ElaB/YqjD/DUF883 family membrane-anchored ribosome-binding protein
MQRSGSARRCSSDHTPEDNMAQLDTTVERARAGAQSAIDDAKATGKDAANSFREVADTMGDALDESLRTRPYATLAVAAGIGFLFGVVWSR